MLGCFDTKGPDFEYLYQCLQSIGVGVITLNVGVQETECSFPIDISAEEVAQTSGVSLSYLREQGDRSLAIEKLGEGAALKIAELVKQNQFDGAIGMGGGGGTFLCLLAMQAIPIGVPKLCLSTVATKDLSRQVGPKDVVLMPSLVDIAGLNRISQMQMEQAAGALVGMMQVPKSTMNDKKPCIAISMFGNTTSCVEACTTFLKNEGYEVLAFHAVGIGGRTMEALIRDGYFDAVLDITTTELADDLCDGICSAGPTRLTAAAAIGIPQVVVPGCLDMVNYGHTDSVPQRYKDRLLFSWAPDVTLMRTNKEENQTLGETIARRLNASKGKVEILIPLKGISKISAEGEIFHQPETDALLFDTIESQISDNIHLEKIDANINDPVFAKRAVTSLLNLINRG